MLHLRAGDLIIAHLAIILVTLLPMLSFQALIEVTNHSELEVGMQGCGHQVFVLKQVFELPLGDHFEVDVVLQQLADQLS